MYNKLASYKLGAYVKVDEVCHLFGFKMVDLITTVGLYTLKKI